MGLYTIGLVNFSGCGESSAGGRGGFFDNEAFLNLDSLGGRQCREYLVEEADKMVQRYAPEYYREIEPPLIDRMIVGSKMIRSLPVKCVVTMRGEPIIW